MRAAIYARYSSDLQSEASIDDQVRLCRERAKRDGMTVSDVYTDYAISGGNLSNPVTSKQNGHIFFRRDASAIDDGYVLDS